MRQSRVESTGLVWFVRLIHTRLQPGERQLRTVSNRFYGLLREPVRNR